jgi:hypothetical protein
MICTLTPTQSTPEVPFIPRVETVMKKKEVEFPDPAFSNWYVLTDNGHQYDMLHFNQLVKISELSPISSKGFTISKNQTTLLSISGSMFSQSKPMEGIERALLSDAIRKTAKKNPTIPGRL